jgi:hypothetical protein
MSRAKIAHNLVVFEFMFFVRPPPPQKNNDLEFVGEKNRSPSWKFYLPVAFLDTVLPKMVDFP